MEKKLDGAVADWLTTVRRPSTQDLSKVYSAAVRLVEAGYPISKSIVERAYRTLLSEKSVSLVTAKLTVPESVKEVSLTRDEYYQIPASETARRMRVDKSFAAAVQKLIDSKQI
jgi:hypothetical protein